VNSGIRVGSLPTADFNATPIPVCASDAVQFTDMSTTADAWVWDFVDGTTSGAQNPSHTYLATGLFDIKLTVTNSGCAATTTKPGYITVRPPIAKFNIVPNCNQRLE